MPHTLTCIALMTLLAPALASSCNATLMQGSCQKTAQLLQTLPDDGPADCCTSCQSNPQCIGFTVNSHANKCYLHSSWVTPTPGDACISARVRSDPPTPQPPAGAKNVFLIIVDDLRPEMAGAYGQKVALTPNLDKFASESTVFNRAYCQQAICGPTRNSFLSGRRPQRTQSWNFIDSFREVGPDWVSFPGYFKNQGYTTLGSGKTYHPGLPPNNDGALSWSQDKEYQDLRDSNWVRPSWVPAGAQSSVQPDATPAANSSHYTDGRNLQVILDDLDYAVQKKDAKGDPVPFFLAYGIHRPHLPFHAPVEMWDQYPATEQIALPKHQAAPDGMPLIAFTYEMDGKASISVFGETRPMPYPNASTALPANMTQAMRKGYYAAVSWMDSLVGQALDRLDTLGLLNNTVVAFIGDHGWQLGEHNIWGKHSNFELGTRVPLLIRDPDNPTHSTVNDLVESVDLYPTIAALAGLQPPPDLDGADLSGYLRAGVVPNKSAVFSEYPRCPSDVSKPWTDLSSCVHTKREDFTVMGYSVRTDEYRYTVWLPWDGENLVGDFSQSDVGVELYNHAGDAEADFDAFENRNLASDPVYAQVVSSHHALAMAHWKKD